MKKGNKLIALAIAALLFIGAAAGCADSTEVVDFHTPAYEDDAEIVAFDLSLEMVPLTEAPAMFSGIAMPSAPGTDAKSNAKAVIDYSNAADGYVMVRYANSIDKRLKVRITGPSGTNYDYNLKQDASWEIFPLSDQNGEYTVGVFENIEGNRFSTSISHKIEVTLKDEFAPFLRPNQYVNFTMESQTAAKAGELTRNAAHLTDKISAIYNFVVSNITYNRTFAEEVSRGMHTNYVPNVDAILASGTGICFDYAAVMAAMLRSQGIPTRLVIGYVGELYHAWIDVYSEEEGWINNVIFFDGEHWKLMDPTFASSSGQSDRYLEFIGDGQNYSVRYLY